MKYTPPTKEFESFIFEKVENKQTSYICPIIIILFSLGLLALYLKVMNAWMFIPLMVVPLILMDYNRFKDWTYGDNQKLNGYFTDRIIINSEEIKIADTKYGIYDILSIEINYNNVYGTIDYNYHEGQFKKNGETNFLIIKLKNNQKIEKFFKIASIEHAKELFDLTESFKNKTRITNNWNIIQKK